MSEHSGRRVKHSRGGCLTCKKRKVRCPENKPICSRCFDDNRTCSYGIQLQWEDDSRRRGIKHGRSTRADRVGLWVPDSTTRLGFPRGQGGKYFVNTFSSDVEGEVLLPILEGLDFRGNVVREKELSVYASPSQMPTLQFAGGSNFSSYEMDGLLFDYCNVVPSPSDDVMIDGLLLDERSVSHSIPLLDSSTNLFRRLILPLATTNETVMHMVLALSALSLTATGQTWFYPSALRHKQRGMQLIREQIASNAIAAANDANVIVILMLCVFEISDNCQVSWATHLCAALDLMRVARSNSPDALGINPEVTEFVSRFFLVKDALGRTACAKAAIVRHEIAPVDSTEIDPSIGCSYELVSIISKVTDLARDMRNPEFDSSAWYEETLKVERQLNTLTQSLPSTSLQQDEAASSSAVLSSTSSLIRAGAQLFFQATIRALNPHSAQARALIAQIIEHTRQLSPDHLRSAHLWPLFVGAVYSSGDDEERVFFLNQFDLLEKEQQALVARGSLKRVKDIVENVWKRRDLDEDGGVGREGVKVGAWDKYVQPLSEGLCLG